MMYGAIIAIVCCYKGMTASGGAEGSAGPSMKPWSSPSWGSVPSAMCFTQTLLHPSPDPGDPVNEFSGTRELLASTGEIGRFAGGVVRDV